MRITKTYRFEASHVLPHHNGKCANLHGHSYRLDVSVEGPLLAGGPQAGMVMDFAELSRAVKQHVVDRLDHTHLNDALENPTCEHLVIWTWATLARALPSLVEIVLWETETARATIRRADVEAVP